MTDEERMPIAVHLLTHVHIKIRLRNCILYFTCVSFIIIILQPCKGPRSLLHQGHNIKTASSHTDVASFVKWTTSYTVHTVLLLGPYCCCSQRFGPFLGLMCDEKATLDIGAGEKGRLLHALFLLRI